MKSPDKPLSEELLRDELLQRGQSEVELDFFQSLPSTNRYLCEAVAASASSSLRLCVAHRQTAGIGRRGRQWHSGATSITLSLSRPFNLPAARLSGLSLVVGVAVTEALVAAGVVGAQLKWPNDVLLDERKLAGILIELPAAMAQPCVAVIGIGINYAPDPEHTGVDQPMITMKESSATLAPRESIIADIVTSLTTACQLFEQSGWSAFADRFERLNFLSGKRVCIHGAVSVGSGSGSGSGSGANSASGQKRPGNGQVTEGRVTGIDENGGLLVEIDGQQQCLLSGEISVRALS